MLDGVGDAPGFGQPSHRTTLALGTAELKHFCERGQQWIIPSDHVSVAQRPATPNWPAWAANVASRSVCGPEDLQVTVVGQPDGDAGQQPGRRSAR